MLPPSARCTRLMYVWWTRTQYDAEVELSKRRASFAGILGLPLPSKSGAVVAICLSRISIVLK